MRKRYIRIWIAGVGTIAVALSCAALFSSSRTEAAMQAAVSATRVDDVPRIKLYGTTPNVVAGRETELDPTEPTLDIYLPQADKATGAAVLILPGGGYQMLTVPGEGAEPAKYFLAHNVAAFVLRYRHGPRYHYPTTLLDAQRGTVLVIRCVPGPKPMPVEVRWDGHAWQATATGTGKR